MSLSKGYMLPKVEKVVLQEKIDLYARASGDCNPIHIDADFANQFLLGVLYALILQANHLKI